MVSTDQSARAVSGRFVSHRRREASDPVRRRAAWIAACAEAERIGALIAAGGAPSRETATLFAGQVVRLSEIAFPAPFDSAAAAAEGFRRLARGFISAARPDMKAAMARAMTAAAVCCRQILDIDIEAAAAEARRRAGERDD